MPLKLITTALTTSDEPSTCELLSLKGEYLLPPPSNEFAVFRGGRISRTTTATGRKRPGQGRILRYRIDFFSVLTVVSVFAFQLVAYFLPLPWYLIIVLPVAIRGLHLVEHNHSHLKIFRQNLFNEMLGWMCFISNGVPVEAYEMHHVHNHHRFAQQYGTLNSDWSSTFGFENTSFPNKPCGRVYYCLTYAPLAWLHCWIEVLRRPGTRMFARFLTSFTLCIGISLFLLIRDPVQYFLWFGIPWALAYVGMANANYDHHRDCEHSTPYNSARDNLSLAFRSFGFNIGYHVEHHMKPTLHWSLLPQFHERVMEEIPVENYYVMPFSRPSSAEKETASIGASAG